jgi:F0F1-type ATP synthase membrane subunit c/vacuolar-type H+-ATPase subunit K
MMEAILVGIAVVVVGIGFGIAIGTLVDRRTRLKIERWINHDD